MEKFTVNASRRRICRGLGYGFGLAGLAHALSIIVATFAPGLLATMIDCRHGRCALISSSAGLLPDGMRMKGSDTPEAIAALDRYLALPGVHLQFFVSQLAMDLPMVGLLIAVALGVHRLGQRRGDDVAHALTWLRLGACFALVVAVTAPLANSYRALLVRRAFDPLARFTLSVEIERFVLNVLLVLVAFAVTWALAEGVKAGRELAEIV